MSGGCQLLQSRALDATALYCDEDLQKLWLPNELDKVTMPTYRVEPPDILTIDLIQSVAQSTYLLQVGDSVALSAVGTIPNEPIAGEYKIGAGGTIELGYDYGAVEVAGRKIDDAVHLIDTHLSNQLRNPKVAMSLRNSTTIQQISGEHLVCPDGTITLGQYGSLSVVGMTLDEIRAAIANHLSEAFANPQVSVSVYAFNSKVYYIITQGGGLGDNLVRFPYTGNETVMDALSQINGLSYASSSRIWIARPHRKDGTNQILPIDWQAMSQRAEVETNYQLLPGDRLYIAQSRLVAFDGAVAKLTSPFERIFGFTILGTSAASRLSGKVLINPNSQFRR